MATKGNGKTIQWLRDHVDYPHDYCLIWPFSTIRGYGNFGYLGEGYYAHAYMCELAHGPAPSPTHQPAHSCGNGHEGCTNPKHLSWKTPSENQMDKQQHGTAQQVGRQRFKLKPEDVAYIRSMKDEKTHDELARIFGVSRRNIGAVIDGRSWGPERKFSVFMPAEDDRVRELHAKGLTWSEIGREMGRLPSSVGRRAKTLGLIANYDRNTFHLRSAAVGHGN